MSALSNRDRANINKHLAGMETSVISLSVVHLGSSIKNLEEKINRQKGKKAIYQRELKRRKRKEKEASA